jgi:uncharacterized protein YgiM (DUF1202 family)
MSLRLSLKLSTLAVAAALLTTAAQAGAFIGGTVIDVKSWDVLNVRLKPTASSNIIDSYDNGDPVSLTGVCQKGLYGKKFSIDVAETQTWKYNRMKATNVWCQVSAPNTNKIGWVRGAFVFPE